jgi:hypothetical protein
MLEATIMENVAPDQALAWEEAFGPAVVLSKYTDYEAALAEVNHSKFGLQAGIFTNDVHKAMRAWDVRKRPPTTPSTAFAISRTLARPMLRSEQWHLGRRHERYGRSGSRSLSAAGSLGGSGAQHMA